MELYFSDYNKFVNNEHWFRLVKTVDYTNEVLEMRYGQNFSAFWFEIRMM